MWVEPEFFKRKKLIQQKRPVLGLSWRVKCHSFIVLKNGPTLASFLFIFVLFKNIYRINCMLQHDSNSERQSSRQARWSLDHHHGPLASFCLSKVEDTVKALQWKDYRKVLHFYWKSAKDRKHRKCTNWQNWHLWSFIFESFCLESVFEMREKEFANDLWLKSHRE